MKMSSCKSAFDSLYRVNGSTWFSSFEVNSAPFNERINSNLNEF